MAEAAAAQPGPAAGREWLGHQHAGPHHGALRRHAHPARPPARGADRTTGDPYAEPAPAWKRWAVVAAIAIVASILWEMGLLRGWLGL
ncbi:MAG: hypothetical protein R3F43_14695 [bacterium]